MSGGHLTPEDRESLRGLGQGQVAAVVEAIVAAHVNAALNEAADAIEATRDHLYVQYGIDLAVRSAYADAARIVRARTT
ncbi:MAG: hypothetical protein JWO15_3870 [Sphingomonadales bacterium]|nr:hypothetical protein [Sphingomonadales bacterium]